LCHECKRVALRAGRCSYHHELNKQKCHENYQARKEKARWRNY
jgi:hypothetical protein